MKFGFKQGNVCTIITYNILVSQTVLRLTFSKIIKPMNRYSFVFKSRAKNSKIIPCERISVGLYPQFRSAV